MNTTTKLTKLQRIERTPDAFSHEEIRAALDTLAGMARHYHTNDQRVAARRCVRRADQLRFLATTWCNFKG